MAGANVTRVVLDGRAVEVRPGRTVLDACREHGVPVPTLCHLDGVSEAAGCRVCLVEVEGLPRPVPACATRVQEGMRIATATDRLAAQRRAAVELLLARGHVCAFCPASGRCELQELARRLGIDHRDLSIRPAPPLDASRPRFALDPGRCVLCARCVRVCAEVERAGTLRVVGRGARTRLATDGGARWAASPSCTDCGRCVAACPTGALLEKATAAQGEFGEGKEAAHPEPPSTGLRAGFDRAQDMPVEGRAAWLPGLVVRQAHHERPVWPRAPRLPLTLSPSKGERPRAPWLVVRQAHHERAVEPVEAAHPEPVEGRAAWHPPPVVRQAHHERPLEPIEAAHPEPVEGWAAPRRLRLATAWLGGCSGCHMSLLDLDERWLELAPHVDLVFSPLCDAREVPADVDLCLVEGAVATAADRELLRRLRERARVLVALGDCAASGNVTAMRDAVGGAAAVLRRVRPDAPADDASLPALLDPVRPLHAEVTVDAFLPGCPPPADVLFSALARAVADAAPRAG